MKVSAIAPERGLLTTALLLGFEVGSVQQGASAGVSGESQL